MKNRIIGPKINQYYSLKQQQKEIEQHLSSLREEIIDHCIEAGVDELESDGFKVKLIRQERKEYDSNKLYEALRDPDLWRMISKPDASKISSLLKMKILTDDVIRNTYLNKTITLLQVDKK